MKRGGRGFAAKLVLERISYECWIATIPWAIVNFFPFLLGVLSFELIRKNGSFGNRFWREGVPRLISMGVDLE